MVALNPSQKAFCRQYLECRNGAEAARRAGYAYGSAKVTAAKMLADPRIQACIERLRTTARQPDYPTVEEVQASHRQLPTIYMAPALSPERDLEAARNLSRAYVIAGLIELFEMCLGRRPTPEPRITIVDAMDEKGRATKVHQVETIYATRFDAGGTIAAAKLLLAEVDAGLATTTPQALVEMELQRRAELTKLLERYKVKAQREDDGEIRAAPIDR